MSLTNSQYDEIMRDYEHTRNENLSEEARRLNEVCKKIPGFKELDLSVPDISLALANKLSGDKSQSLEEIKKELSSVRMKKRKLLAEHSFPEDYLDKIYACADCRDTGYADGEYCHCFKAKKAALLYEQSHLGKLIKTNNFDIMRLDLQEGEDLEHFKKAVEVCKKFILDFKEKKNPGNILFYGTVGTGKSFLTIAVAKEILDAGYGVLYFSAVDFFERLSDAVFRSEDRDERKSFYGDVFDCPLLIIDDLGAELTNSFVSTELFNLINERHLRGVSTLISTNLDFDELGERYTDRIFSRLVSFYNICELTGQDARVALS